MLMVEANARTSASCPGTSRSRADSSQWSVGRLVTPRTKRAHGIRSGKCCHAVTAHSSANDFAGSAENAGDGTRTKKR